MKLSKLKISTENENMGHFIIKTHMNIIISFTDKDMKSIQDKISKAATSSDEIELNISYTLYKKINGISSPFLYDLIAECENIEVVNKDLKNLDVLHEGDIEDIVRLKKSVDVVTAVCATMIVIILALVMAILPFMNIQLDLLGYVGWIFIVLLIAIMNFTVYKINYSKITSIHKRIIESNIIYDTLRKSIISKKFNNRR